ncbi:MAG: beta-ketoacyl-ACP synthase III [Gammaproteobacteria bacterium]|nr:beta-ketoacyl-ACP synthase III [Gammaproteobacteria bacterium]MBU1553591.1 beta-ketoacyl-ACP synthase III [Gammaproteobacteria bacterium]MBU2070585.1 beta-ketoacyl-ACP synthase III [Gammaproteobacteria bacterium]MBU2181993.1 beta-ketoacyl-ACP synthase III [Gammaproteobacteria bacterium]MBU2207091.1 beta-ketoacyl-ACP synthase III [Gammaproteobacteria bacterium]
MSTHPVYISRIAAELPFDAVSNEQMENRLGLVGDKPSRARRLILRSNGIKQRHYVIDPASGEPAINNAQLAAAAIRKLCRTPEQLNSIECLAASSSAPDQLMPNHAVMVHGELGNPPCEVVATAGICLCGITALKYAWMSVASGNSRNAVACGSEVASNMMHARNFSAEAEAKLEQLGKQPELAFEKDFLRWMLSDGAGAVWLQNEPASDGLSLRVHWIEVMSFANQLPACMYAGAEQTNSGLQGWTRFDADSRAAQSVMAVKQDVKLLNDNIVPVTVEQALRRVLQKHPLQSEQIDHFLPHYSSEYFRDRLLQGLQNIDFVIPQSKWFTNLTTKGNTGSASIFIMLEELFHSGRLQPGEQILCYIPESGRFSSAFMLLEVVSHET